MASLADFRKLLLGALRVPDVARCFLVRPALFPRLAQAARGRFARLDPPLREIRFHGDLRHCQFQRGQRVRLSSPSKIRSACRFPARTISGSCSKRDLLMRWRGD